MKKNTDDIDFSSFQYLCIDSSVFISSGFNFNSSALKSLDALTEGYKILFPRMLRHELVKHYKASYISAKRSLKNSLDKIKCYDDEAYEEMLKIIKKSFPNLSDSDVFKLLVSNLQPGSAIELTEDDLLSVSDLVDLYIELRPPFSKEKKSEFPDAIILKSIEAFCTQNSSKCVVVSSDKDWMAYAQSCDSLLCVDDLSEFADSFLSFKNTRYTSVDDYVSRNEAYIAERIKEEISIHDFDVDLQIISSHYYEADLNGYDVDEVMVNDYSLIDLSGGDAVVEFNVSVKIDVDYSVSFYHYADKEYYEISSSSDEVCSEFNLKVYIEFLECDGKYEIDDIDFSSHAIVVNIEMEPNY